MNICLSLKRCLLLVIILSIPNYFLSAEEMPRAAYLRLRGSAAQTKSANFSNPLWEKGNKAEGSTLGVGLLFSGEFSPSFHIALGFSLERRKEKYSIFEIEHSGLRQSLAVSYYFYDNTYLGLAYSTVSGHYRDFKGTSGRNFAGTGYDLSLGQDWWLSNRSGIGFALFYSKNRLYHIAPNLTNRTELKHVQSIGIHIDLLYDY